MFNLIAFLVMYKGNGCVWRILSRYNQNSGSLLNVYGTGLSSLNLYYSIICDLSVEMHMTPITLFYI